MNRTRLAIFGIIIFLAFAITHLSSPVFAETVAKSTSFEKTTLLEYTNNEGVPIKTIRMWLGSDAGSFMSFKTEKGWTGTLSPQGLLTFTSEDPLAPGGSVKFGIKTQAAGPRVNWKTLDASNNELTIGTTVPGQTGQPSQGTPPTQTQDNKPKVINFDNAVLKIIPETPKNGDSIRVVGYGFPTNTRFDFLLDGQKLADFTTDNAGHILGRTKVPADKEADRVEFSLKDDQGNKKVISLRLEHKEAQVPKLSTARFTVIEGTNTVEPGKSASVSGTAKPGATVVISYKDSSGNKIQAATVEADTQGNWSYEKIISPDTPLGTYQVELSDGTDTITKTLTVALSRILHVTSSQTRYEPGETMSLNGTASADKSVEVIINDPIGKEIFSDILDMQGTTQVNFEFPTTQTSMKGTYVILLTQGEDTQILRIGLGETPSEQIVAKFDKISYLNTDKPKLLIQGPAKASISILIIDPSDKAKATDTVTLGVDGNAEYEIDLTDYKTGIYTVVLKHLKSQVEEVFGVGLLQGSGQINIQTTKAVYQLGDGVLILGTTEKPNVLLTLEMSGPDGKIIKHKQTFSDKDGKFSDGTFRVPSDAVQGTWIIKASSGSNHDEASLNVVGTVEQKFVISVDQLTPYHVGDFIKISGTGGGKTQTVIATIFDSKDVKVIELNTFSKSDGSFQITWKVPPETTPDTYKVKATIGNDSAETTFQIQ